MSTESESLQSSQSLQSLQATSLKSKKLPKDDDKLADADVGGNLKVPSGENIFVPTNKIQLFGTKKSPSIDKNELLNTHIDNFQETLDTVCSYNNILKYVNVKDREHHPTYDEEEHVCNYFC